MKTDLKSLLNPNFRHMTQEDRLLRAVMLAFIKHIDPNAPAAMEIGWNELGEILQNEICNTIGDDEFVKWRVNL